MSAIIAPRAKRVASSDAGSDASVSIRYQAVPDGPSTQIQYWSSLLQNAVVRPPSMPMWIGKDVSGAGSMVPVGALEATTCMACSGKGTNVSSGF
jgi:hypothetical protein